MNPRAQWGKFDMDAEVPLYEYSYSVINECEWVQKIDVDIVMGNLISDDSGKGRVSAWSIHIISEDRTT